MQGHYQHSSSERPETDDDTLFTTSPAIDSVFTDADEIELAGITRILDIGCGSGSWLQKVAHVNPTIQVVGIDINSVLVEEANACAREQGLSNAHFAVMDARQPLLFDDASFDLVNAHSLAIFLHTHQWPELLAECKRILRPGGLIRMAEGEGPITNKPAFDQFAQLYHQMMHSSGHSFSGTGRYLANGAALSYLLRTAGFRYVQQKARIIDLSYGAKGYASILPIMQGLHPLLLASHLITAEELAHLKERVLLEMQEEDFRALWYIVTAWGEAPNHTTTAI